MLSSLVAPLNSLKEYAPSAAPSAMAEISTTDLWGSAKQADALPANVAAAAPAALRRVSVERVSVN